MHWCGFLVPTKTMWPCTSMCLVCPTPREYDKVASDSVKDAADPYSWVESSGCRFLAWAHFLWSEGGGPPTLNARTSRLARSSRVKNSKFRWSMSSFRPRMGQKHLHQQDEWYCYNRLDTQILLEQSNDQLKRSWHNYYGCQGVQQGPQFFKTNNVFCVRRCYERLTDSFCFFQGQLKVAEEKEYDGLGRKACFLSHVSMSPCTLVL